MEEQIREIIKVRINPYLSNTDEQQKDNAAEEIASHVMEFIEWSSDKHFDGTRWWIQDEEALTTNELYNYWLTNIKTKSHVL